MNFPRRKLVFDKLKSAPIVPKAEVKHFLYTWDWKSFIEDHLTEKSLENHSFYHSFKFFKDGDTVLMQAKHLPQDIESTPSTGIRLVKENADGIGNKPFWDGMPPSLMQNREMLVEK